MLNTIWLCLILVSVVIGGVTGKLPEVTSGGLTAAKDAVLAIGLPLWGAMALWLGIMRLAERSGFAQLLARALRPLMRRLFPDVPPDDPAMGAIGLSVAANMLGLGNAATPLGLRAMAGLERLNPRPGVATNAMCTFLAICTSSVQLVPTTAISLFVAAGAKDPTAIVSTAFLATACAACAGVFAAKVLERLPLFRVEAADERRPAKAAAGDSPVEIELEKIAPEPLGKGRYLLFLFLGFFLFLFVGMAFPEVLPNRLRIFPLPVANRALAALNVVTVLAVPFLLSFFPLYAALRGVKVYDQFVEGAKESFSVILRIIPFLVAMLVAIAMLRESGGIALLSKAVSPVLGVLRFPADLLPLVLMRPLSGGATFGIFSEIVKRFGPDSFTSRLGGTIYGSTETTFYVLTVYFGSVGIRRTRHAVAAGLIADFTGVVASTVICHAVFG